MRRGMKKERKGTNSCLEGFVYFASPLLSPNGETHTRLVSI